MAEYVTGGPLLWAARQIGSVGTAFFLLRDSARRIPILGEYLAPYFDYGYRSCYWTAHYLFLADQRIETLDLDTFLWSPGAWVLIRLGADIGRATYYRNQPWEWFIWKFRKQFLLLDAFLAGDLEWIWDYLLRRWDELHNLVRSPSYWVYGKLQEYWPGLYEIIHFPGRWVLIRLGADVGRAMHFQARPWEWFIWKFRKEHPPLDALLAQDSQWLFNWLMITIEHHLERHIDWLVMISERMLNRIWEKRG